MRFGLLVILVLGNFAHAEQWPGVENPARAKVNYMLNCQGCHQADGSGTGDDAVPSMRNFIGLFLTVPGGRDFLVQVPGAANSSLSDAALAELLNWMLPTLSGPTLPKTFRPYTAQEVKSLRQQPLVDVHTQRSVLIAQMGR